MMGALRLKLGFTSKLVFDSVGRSGGLSLLWSDSVVVDLLSYSKFHIDVKVTSRNVSELVCETSRVLELKPSPNSNGILVCNRSGGLGAMNRVVSAIQNCTKKLTVWNSRNRCALKMAIGTRQRDLKNLTETSHPSSWKAIREVENQPEELLGEEEDYWRQQSQVVWLKNGDRNTNFFQWKASSRRARNRMHGLFDDRNRWSIGKHDLERIVVGYFSQLFTAYASHREDIT
ncbi:hypothetical protein Dsin_009371 [Dipteronia sinensis]|uniref:Uncharacterized protein n=1 Tax=Dipteronia sinensis TaxID=43782 RepID=A0AAE0AQJ1_9ROSI|nr:hypothetical protein Dsin_009371 [Dipteronia sinensis]